VYGAVYINKAYLCPVTIRMMRAFYSKERSHLKVKHHEINE